MLLGRRTKKVFHEGKWCVKKTALSPSDLLGLENEAYWLSFQLEFSPKFISWCRLEGILYMQFIPGETLNKKQISYTKMYEKVKLLHKRGIIFCDLRPENILIDADEQIKFLDWEFAGQSGQVIADMARRPFSSGWSHPDLIWGHHKLREEIDYYSLVRMHQTGYLL